jgi:hypothetical protein
MMPQGLERIANGRDNISLIDAAFAMSVSPQTIRKELHLNNNFHGLKSIKIGARHYFKVLEIAEIITKGTI